MQTITKLWLVPSAKQRRDLCSWTQRTQRSTGSAFRISLQPDWRSRQTKQRAFLTGQSWRVLKSGYTAGSSEQGFRRCFADGVNQSLISSARRLLIRWALISATFLSSFHYFGVKFSMHFWHPWHQRKMSIISRRRSASISETERNPQGGGGGEGLLRLNFAGYVRWPLRAPFPLQTPVVVTLRQIGNFRDPDFVTFFFFYELTHFKLNEVHFTIHLQYKHSGSFATLLKMRPHDSQSSRENATPFSGTSPLASYKEVPTPCPHLSHLKGNYQEESFCFGLYV